MIDTYMDRADVLTPRVHTEVPDLPPLTYSPGDKDLLLATAYVRVEVCIRQAWLREKQRNKISFIEARWNCGINTGSILSCQDTPNGIS